ncbi:hypothetical protein P4T48_27015 [Bacillus paramycoides]|uniref:hypothetical protein n=1 Tax=Bacillus paramycoides TaxID=2026194 RepID=UPI002E1B106B|nr:hypothetical protein [Bacillus paramycoides]
MRKIDIVPKPFFETVGEQGKTYFVYGYATGEPKLSLGMFDSLKEARQFIYKYAHENPQWLNGNGDINEYNNKPSRLEKDNEWYEGGIKQEYTKYTDFKDWKKMLLK